jgi:hypothetical protein
MIVTGGTLREALNPAGGLATAGVSAAVDARALPIALRREFAAVTERDAPDALTILPTAEEIPTAMSSAALGGVDDDDESVAEAMLASTFVAADSSAESGLGPLTASAAARFSTMLRRAPAIIAALVADVPSVGAFVIRFANATDCDTAVLK